MPVAALTVELHLPLVHSLKEKRSIVKPIVEQARVRFHVAASELDHQDTWQRTTLGFAAVGASGAQVGDVLDAVERFVWSRSDVEVLRVEHAWLEVDA